MLHVKWEGQKRRRRLQTISSMKNQNAVHDGSEPVRQASSTDLRIALDKTPRTIVTAIVTATSEKILDRTSFWRKVILAFHNITMGNIITVLFNGVSNTQLFMFTRTACRVQQLTNKIRNNADSGARFEDRVNIPYFCRAACLPDAFVSSYIYAFLGDDTELNCGAGDGNDSCNPPKGCISRNCGFQSIEEQHKVRLDDPYPKYI